MKQAAYASLALLLSCSTAAAQSCVDLCDTDWWQSATQAEIEAAIASADVNARDANGWTALFGAAVAGTPEKIIALNQVGVDVNARDEDGRTALFWAALAGAPENVMAVVEAGADVNARNEDGRTALFWAAADNVMALVEAGLEANAQDKNGWTALHSAALTGSPEKVMALLEAGVDAALPSRDGTTAFVVAKHNDKLKGTDAYWLLNDARFK